MAHPVDVHVGKKLREIRTKLRMSQETLAKNSGITFQQVQKYERATNRISVSRMFEFACILKAPLSYFFEGLDDDSGYQLAEETAAFEHEDKSLDNEIKELVSAYRNIKDPEMRRSAKMMLIGIGNGSTIL